MHTTRRGGREAKCTYNQAANQWSLLSEDIVRSSTKSFTFKHKNPGPMRKAPPCPQKVGAVIHLPLIWGESGVPRLKSALSHHTLWCSHTETWGIIWSTGASFMCALLPEHLTVSYAWQHRLSGKPHQLITLGTELYSYSHF